MVASLNHSDKKCTNIKRNVTPALQHLHTLYVPQCRCSKHCFKIIFSQMVYDIDPLEMYWI